MTDQDLAGTALDDSGDAPDEDDTATGRGAAPEGTPGASAGGQEAPPRPGEAGTGGGQQGERGEGEPGTATDHQLATAE
eukprot:4603625-Lingulodinium_polyedra.AAC.1